MRGALEALEALTEAVGTAVDADAAVVRSLDEERGELVAQAVWGATPAFTAQLAASRRKPGADGHEDGGVLRLPVRSDGRVVGELEVRRLRRPFRAAESRLAETAAAQAGIVLAALELQAQDSMTREHVLQLVGDALAAPTAGAESAEQIVRLAREATGAAGAVIWRITDGDAIELLASDPPLESGRVDELHAPATRALEARGQTKLDPGLVTLRLGEPPLGALQLLFEAESMPSAEALSLLATFGVRAAHALRSTETLTETTAELQRTRALVTVIGQAIAQLSLAHTLETAIERIAELLGVDRVAVYLRDDGRLQPVAARELVGPHARIGERLLALALGPFRGRGTLILRDAASDESLAQVRSELAEAGIEAALAVPLVGSEEVIGLLAVYPPRGRVIDENEAALIGALAAQLAVAVENARLHEEAKRLGSELEQALGAERHASRHLRALYEISRSFTHSLSLDATLDAVTRTAVEALGIDAAAVRMPDERGDVLETRSVHVAEPNRQALAAILSRSQPMGEMRRIIGSGSPLVLDRRAAAALPAHELLVPFLDKGASCVIVPVATPGEVLATLTLLSLDPSRPLTQERTELALSIAGQAALAIDNARLYQQQKGFADTMQRSLLPRVAPRLEGLDVGAVYESSARVDVGGDLYDFLVLADGRLSVVLGDVTGHGVDAAADMAMAKFVFRSLAREHPEPGDFLASANDVVTSEISIGKFITLAYVRVDAVEGEVACATAGHPPPRLVHSNGEVVELAGRGLPLGVEAGESYEEVRDRFEPGATLVLYTDGVVEERRGTELYGVERLDAVLERNRRLPAKELAAAVIADCRAFGGGDLSDDCAIVVIQSVARGADRPQG